MGKEMTGHSSRVIGYSTGAIVLIILGIVLSSQLFVIAGVICLGLVILSIGLIPKRPGFSRELERVQIFEGGSIKTRVEIDGRVGAGNLEIFDKVSPSLELKGSSNSALVPPGKRSFDYMINAPLRGYHDIGPASIRRWDPLWLWFSEGSYGNKDELTVFPVITPIAGRSMQVKRYKHRPGEMKLKRVGMGKEFHSIRDYNPTDPFNTINWKAYARTRKLLVNQFEAESVTDIMFLIDARMVTRVGTMVENPLERSIRLAGSMAARLLQGSNRVGSIIYGSTVTVIKPKGGPSALTSMMHDLTNITPMGYNTLGSTIEYSLPYLPPNVPIFLLSPLSEDPTTREAVKNLIGRGHPLTIISPAGVEFERIVYMGKLTPRYLLKRLSRENMLKDIRSMGARVIDWTPDKDLFWAMEEVWK
ncbi:MAG: DUF58 domain-containing protein [Candidatus Thermoplasmatota archaeon]|nr:DUF58 domain-containing protein [Candidatus Thermoplasmatota archaeon]